jgi:hypothetical protein
MTACPRVYSSLTLLVLLVVWIIVSALTSYLLYARAFNQDPATHWVLMGNLTSSSISFRVRNTVDESSDFQMFQNGDDDDETLVYEIALSTLVTQQDEVHSLHLPNLTASSNYSYKYWSTGTATKTLLQEGSFRTAPPLNSTETFRFAASSCAYTGTTHDVFGKLLQQKSLAVNNQNSPLLFMLHLGDIHYEDLSTPSVPKRVEAIDIILGASKSKQFYGNLPLVYMWDDHDFLGNNLGGLDANKADLQAALEQYRITMPHYSLVNASHSMYHAFTIGRVRFLVSDLRSEQGEFTQIMSSQQEAWLLNEFAQSDEYDFVVWATSVPWIGINDNDPSDPSDAWWGYPQQRQRISKFLSSDQLPKRNVIAMAGDSHMLALDDGSNTYYGGDDSSLASFPILQTGPLDRFGSFKGGPFSEGCYANKFERNHQYSIIEYSNTGNEPCLSITAYAVSDITGQQKEVFVKEFCGTDIFAQSGGEASCKETYFSTTNYVLFGISAGLLLAILGLLLFSKIFDRWLTASFMTLIVATLVGLVYGAGVGMPYLVGGTDLFDSFSVALIGLLTTLSVFGYLVAWLVSKRKADSSPEQDEVGD